LGETGPWNDDGGWVGGQGSLFGVNGGHSSRKEGKPGGWVYSGTVKIVSKIASMSPELICFFKNIIYIYI
jgi:hypothetical protein